MAKKWHQLERLDHKALKKLQQERKKAAELAKAAADRKRNLIIGGAVLFCVILLLTFVHILRSKYQAEAIQKAREALKVAQVTSVKGKVTGRDIGPWDKTKAKFHFSKDYSFKTGENGAVSIQLQLENVLKLAKNSEIRVKVPELEKKEVKIKKEAAELKYGELTVAIALDGRDLLEIKVGRVLVEASSGLFKIIYDERKEKGEVVVKNGVVTVKKVRSHSKGKKVTGFYKITFKGNKISNPTQASVIQYNWR